MNRFIKWAVSPVRTWEEFLLIVLASGLLGMGTGYGLFLIVSGI